ncbi:M-phase-specific PLK1-interacting protein [Pleuronectes platessa]|uniref:M-phase-specific PLK1-interacting protein n=1 Tax=Pleuronectes platessa TaxID=8262 RepID=UPI00232A4AF3|nr:M-phase-specific PLK1-interacting protein [Pleuronectes platessa]
MNRGPFRPQRSPGAPRPAGRFPSPGSSWGFPGARSPYGGSGHRGASPRGCGAYSPGSPVNSPGSGRGYWDGPTGGFGSGSRCFPGQMRSRGDSFRRPQSFGPGSAQKFQSSDASVEKYFSPSMVQDPWRHLQPLTTTDAAHNRHTT